MLVLLLLFRQVKPALWKAPLEGRSLLLTVIAIFQQIARLTVQRLAQLGERGDTDGLGFSVFQNGHVGKRDADALGQLGHTHFSPSQHDVNVEYDFILKLHVYTSSNGQIAQLLQRGGAQNQMGECRGSCGDGDANKYDDDRQKKDDTLGTADQKQD